MACGDSGRRVDGRRARGGRRRRRALRAAARPRRARASRSSAPSRTSRCASGCAPRAGPARPAFTWDDGRREDGRGGRGGRRGRGGARERAAAAPHRHRRPQADATSGSAPTSATSSRRSRRRPESEAYRFRVYVPGRDRDALPPLPANFEVVAEESPGLLGLGADAVRLAADARPARPLPRHALRPPAARTGRAPS